MTRGRIWHTAAMRELDLKRILTVCLGLCVATGLACGDDGKSEDDGTTSGDGDGDPTTTGDGDGDPNGCPADESWFEGGCQQAPDPLVYTEFSAGCYVPCEGENDICAVGTCERVWYEDLCPCPPWQNGCCDACGGAEAWICLP